MEMKNILEGNRNHLIDIISNYSQDMIVKKKIKKDKKEETKYIKIKNNTAPRTQPKEKKISLFD